MLRRRPIRIKLAAAMGLLSAIVCLLAFSGFWGLYRYRRLAKAVGQRASEIPLAGELHRLAQTLRDSHYRIVDLERHEGMIDSRLLEQSRREDEKRLFRDTLVALQRTLQKYQRTIAARQGESELLVDTARRKRSLSAIGDTCDAVALLDQKPLHPVIRRQQLFEELDSLVAETRDHAESINEAMAAVSIDVKGQYRTWIAVAWVCFALAITMVGVLLWSFWTLVVQPFRTLLDGSRLVAGGEFGHRIDLGTGDELSELAEALNAMSNRFQQAYSHSDSLRRNLQQQVRDRTRELIRNEQLASVGFLAAGVAHEINNPLTTIAWGAESLESQVSELLGLEPEQRHFDEELVETLQSILAQIQSEAFRCKGITERLLDFSRMSEVRREPTDMAKLVEDVVGLVSRVGEFRCKTIRTHCDGPVTAAVSAHQIRQVVLNLVTNALESVDSDGAVDIHISRDETNARIVVEDNGCGMSEEVMTHLFEPFYTRRRDGTGTGLGLSITCRIVSQHGGSLAPYSEGEGRGSRFELLLPLQAECDDNAALCPSPLEWNHEPYQAA